MPTKLFLASSSPSRQQLLRDAGIPFVCIRQTAQELLPDGTLSLEQLVTAIAVSKMEHAQLSAPASTHGKEIAPAYLLTADTLSRDARGIISGKPADKEQARALLVAARDGMCTGTAFCLEQRIWTGHSWQLANRIVGYVQASYQFNVPDDWLERYLEHSRGLNTAGAIALEGFGSLFVPSIEGSYTTIIGLPMCQLRESLEDIGFFGNK